MLKSNIKPIGGGKELKKRFDDKIKGVEELKTQALKNEKLNSNGSETNGKEV